MNFYVGLVNFLTEEFTHTHEHGKGCSHEIQDVKHKTVKQQNINKQKRPAIRLAKTCALRDRVIRPLTCNKSISRIALTYGLCICVYM